MATLHPSAGYTLTVTVSLEHVPGTLGRLTSAIGAAGASLDAVDILENQRGRIIRQLRIQTRSEAHGHEVVEAVEGVRGVQLVAVVDQVFALHEGGKIEVTPRSNVATRDDLAMAYTPGVGRVSRAIADDPALAWEYTGKGNAVAVLTDGTAVLGLGNIGPEAAMPVMEGKAMLFKQLAGIDAYPVCVRTSSVDELVAVAKAIAPGFGGINLEDIAAPGCFVVERRLQEELDIPVFHDDQHGTAVVSLAALYGAASVAGKHLEELSVVCLGAGAAGIACINLWRNAGVRSFKAFDKHGMVSPGRTDLDPEKQLLAEWSNPEAISTDVADALKGADVLLGLSGPGLVKPEWVAGMADNAIVFAMANPIPEIMPEEMPPNVAVVATGRSDYVNQINNVLVFPGVFRGLLDSRAKRVDDGMKIAAARALADIVIADGIDFDYVIPSIFDDRVVPAVSSAVHGAAERAGLAR